MNRTLDDIISERDDLIGNVNHKDYTVSVSNSFSNINKNSILRSIINDTTLSIAFFSDKNISKLQNQIRFNIYNELKHKISNQSPHELIIVMRSVFLQNSKNLAEDISGQITELNSIVIKNIMPKLISSVEQYDTYLKDTNTLPVPMAHPAKMTGTGNRNLDVTQIYYN
jgi:hypothetical protein